MKKCKLIAIVTLITICVCSFCTFGACNNANTPIPPVNDEHDLGISINKVDNLPTYFIKGVDVSSVIAQENGGITYKNSEGQKQDIFKTLADAGVNYIRVRVWNNPFDANSNGYGGGNCDVNNAVKISQRAKQYNLKLCVDFHYSDFWADPQNQCVPKAWQSLTLEQKCQEIYNFTLSTLQSIAHNGAEIGIVQIGNEINNGLCGETDETKVAQLLKQASKAVRDFATQTKSHTKVAVHYAGLNIDGFVKYKAKYLHDNNVDYDVFGVSFYNYWHGTLQNLTDTLLYIKSTYKKDTIILETAYPYTTNDGDGHNNNVGASDLVKGYPASRQGQANNLRDVIDATNKAGGLGVFYWEPAWIPINTDKDDSLDTTLFDTNLHLWEKYGCGWATSFAGEYNTDAQKWYGGSSWDNQALFDYYGIPLPSLYVFSHVNDGYAKK